MKIWKSNHKMLTFYHYYAPHFPINLHCSQSCYSYLSKVNFQFKELNSQSVEKTHLLPFLRLSFLHTNTHLCTHTHTHTHPALSFLWAGQTYQLILYVHTWYYLIKNALAASVLGGFVPGRHTYWLLKASCTWNCCFYIINVTYHYIFLLTHSNNKFISKSRSKLGNIVFTFKWHSAIWHNSRGFLCPLVFPWHCLNFNKIFFLGIINVNLISSWNIEVKNHK